MTSENDKAKTKIPRRKLALFTVALGQFMCIITLMTVSTALPTIGAEMDIELSEAGWIVSAFLFGLSAFVLIAGRLGDLYGYRKVFVFGLVQFTFAGTLAGFAPEIATLSLARFVQGVGAALILGTTYAIVADMYAMHERGRAMGVVLASAPSGGLVGLALSPLILAQFSWNWIFIITTTPFGIVALGLAWIMGTKDPSERQGSVTLDMKGSLLFGAFMGFLLLSFSHLHEGEETFQAGWKYHTSMQVLAVIFLGIFVWYERRIKNPLIPLHLFRNKNFTAACLANGILHMTMMTIFFTFPFMVENGLQRSNAETAALLIVFSAFSAPFSILSGWIYDKTHWELIKPISLAGVGTCLGGLGLAVWFSVPYMMLYMILVALGVCSGLFITPISNAIMVALPSEYKGFASGMVETSRHVGHSFGAAIATVIMGFSILGSLSQSTSDPILYLEAFRNVGLIVGSIAILGTIPSAIKSSVPVMDS
jgi:MFS family permease|tara:strand:- start:2158 stop:3600 length:1443 start_codon:yes stop_codon:yes gene_type:complete